MTARPIHIMIKPSSGMCNMDCTYCFYHDIAQKRVQASYGFMSEKTFSRVVERAFEYTSGEITIAFQGGEPTLIGLDFFRKAVEAVDCLNVRKQKIHYALQTNGYRLTRAWGEFFKEHNFLIGLSIDGTIHTHDAYRLDGAGHPTFEGIMATAQMFKDCGVDFNILTVVNKKTAASIEKIYRFYKKQGFAYLQFIACLDPIGEAPAQHAYSLTPEMYAAFLCTLFDLWYEDLRAGRIVSIRFFDNLVYMLMGQPPESCDMGGICSAQHVVESDGSVYPCDFYVFEALRLGNVETDSFESMQARRGELGFIEKSRVTDEVCLKCRHYALCRGGCRRHRMTQDGEAMARNYFCAAYKRFYDHAAPRLAEIARRMMH